MQQPAEPDAEPELDPVFTALLADPRIELRPPSAAISIGDLRRGATAFLTRATGPDLHEVRSLTTDDGVASVATRLYRPSAQQGLPVILFIHGGGFVFGSLDTHDSMCRTLAEETGAALLAVDYRCAPEAVFPAAADDCLRALRWVRDNAVRLGLDRDRIALAGDSAGGQLAVVTAMRAREEDIALRHLALFYPLADPSCSTASSHRFARGFMLSRAFVQWCWTSYAGNNGVCRGNPFFDLTIADLRGLPPTTIITAGHDPLRDEGEALADRIEQAGSAVSRRRYPGMIHGFAGLPQITPIAIDALRYASMSLKDALAHDGPGASIRPEA